MAQMCRCSTIFALFMSAPYTLNKVNHDHKQFLSPMGIAVINGAVGGPQEAP